MVRTSLVLAACMAVAAQAAAASCEGSHPWKSPDAIQYPESELRAFHELARSASSAFSHGDIPSAEQLAKEYSAAAIRFKCDWNYGNAVHNANAILGLVALSGGDRASAVRYLHQAGLSRGSPQLNSFGPSLLLAKRLAEAGEFEAVAAYILSIRRFWEARDTTLLAFTGFRDPQPMSTWLEALASRKVPDFGMNAGRAP